MLITELGLASIHLAISRALYGWTRIKQTVYTQTFFTIRTKWTMAVIFGDWQRVSRCSILSTSWLMLTQPEYKVDIEDLTSLAIVTFKIPDLSDPAKKAMLPPSQHKNVSGLLFQGCAQAEDPLAIVQIMTAVYLSSASPDQAAKEIAGLFPRNALALYRKTLEVLCSKAQKIALGPDALTLRGLFLESEGQKQKAEDSYREAILRSHLKFQPGSKHPMQLPLIAPWNALGYLLKSSKDPKVQAQAKTYFEQGALQGDDPHSYYELSHFEPGTSPKWLQYTSKAAASGHKEAIVNLANFYMDVSSENSPILEDSAMRKALNWVLGWKSDSPAQLAREWLHAASNIGHKPSLLRLADIYSAGGDTASAHECLRRILTPPAAANQKEEWPQLVQLAKKRLAVFQT
jgi:tetratricopeptide (TPR) repeat protein